MHVRFQSSGENLCVGGSNPSSRTNLPATETPDFVAEDMFLIAGQMHGVSLLEPSAGTGNIAIAARRRGANVTCVELNGDKAHHLRQCGFPTIHADFLTLIPENLGWFKAIIMCPPLNSMPHILHAIKFLKPDGILVALVRKDAITLTPDFHYWPLPDDMFAMNGQNVSCGLLTYRA